ncbi:primary-amine oxidase [Paenibacillus sp. TRM 82003]|nr:primary-amine oxidase [Paenibacillus sp. TRM 82003]
MSVNEAELRKSVVHPLEPLTESEITEAVRLVREGGAGAGVRFVSVALHEPEKSVVLGFDGNGAFEREAAVVLLDNADGKCYEAIVSISQGKVVSWTHVPGVQPNIMLDEFEECEAAVKASPAFREALAKRGIDDVDLVMVDPWSAGHFGRDEESTVRLSRTLSWVRADATDNGYAYPLEGIIAVVDLNKMEVIRVEDYGVVPLPPKDGNYAANRIGLPLRTDVKPIEITQPEGPSFTFEGHEVSWQKWNFRFSFNPREGLVLHTVSYVDEGRKRPILYRASLSEMVVPYGDPGPTQYTKNAFDAGEYGIGALANSLTYGCDCVGHIQYFDAVMTNSRGELMKIKNAICMHEEDYGILWKHTDWRTNDVEVRRSRRLVISSISTVANYEYGFFWYFYQDGTIQFEVKLTGILSTGALPPGETSKYGTLVAPQLYAPNHQHFFNVRLDMMVDGRNNSVYEVNTVPESEGPHNPWGNAFYAASTRLETEAQARRNIDLNTARYWKIVNESERNEMGQPVSYKLVTGENCAPMASADSSLMRRAGFISNHVWVTPYDRKQMHAGGQYPNQSEGEDGLSSWTEADRPVADTDVVLWYTMGHNHIPRPEDWPVMPAHYIGFMLKPVGFFEANPGLDVPPASKKGHCGGKSA